MLWSVLDAIRWTNDLRREMCANKSIHSSPVEPPAPNPWREQVPEEPDDDVSVQQSPWIWPSHLQLHLLCHSLTAIVSLNMWFYILHLKLCGHLFMQWSTVCVKMLCPSFEWNDVKWPFLILPNCKWKERLTLLGAIPGYLCKLLLRDSYYRPKPQSPTNSQPKVKPQISPTKKAMLLALAAFATIQSTQSLQPCKLRKCLQRFKNPSGGLHTNRLSQSKTQQAVHKAFITRVAEDTAEFEKTLSKVTDENVGGGCSKPRCISSVVDSGASFTAIKDLTLVMPNSMQKLPVPIELDGIAGGCTVEYKCMIQFECVDKNGDPFTRQTIAYYHPDLPCTLLSPQAFLKDQHHQKMNSDTGPSKVEDCFTIYRHKVAWHSDGTHLMDLPYDVHFLPRLHLFPVGKSETILKAYHTSVLSPSNKNLSPLKKIWLRLHNVLGHPSFSLVQQLAVAGWFDTKVLGLPQLPASEAPMCEACKYGKQTRRPDGTTTVSKVQEKEGALKQGLTEPGQRIFSDS